MKLRLFAVAAAVVPSLSAADTPPPATASVDISTAYVSGATSTFGKATGECQYYNCTITTFSSYEDGDLALNAVGTAQWPVAGASATGNGSFYFTVNGPAGGEAPIDISVNASTLAGDDSIAAASIAFGGSFMMSAASCQATSVPASYCSGYSSLPTSFAGTYALGDLSVGSTYRVTESWVMYDYALAELNIDPMVFIDPAWAAENPGYSLSFSPNASAPEPATWAMVLLGFCSLGAVLRRRMATTLWSRPAPDART